MEVLNRVKVNPTICGVELAFRGSLSPSNIPGWQPFYNSLMKDTDFAETYMALGSVSFGEESNESAAGVSYSQKVLIRFPTMDKSRATRMDLMHQVRFVKLNLSNGLNIVVGRNDVAQNSKPKITTKSNHQMAEVTFETVSIFPSGLSLSGNIYSSGNYAIGFPYLIPIKL